MNGLAPYRSWNVGEGRPLLALHCSLAHSGAFAGLAAGLPGWAFHAMDLPGHGRCPPWDGVSDPHDEACRNARALVRHLDPAGAGIDLLGHSFGGTVALRLAVENPGLFRRLILIEPVYFAAARPGDGPGWRAFDAHTAHMAEPVRSGDLAEAARRFHGEWGGGERLEDLPPATQAYILDRIAMIPPQTRSITEDRQGVLAPGRLEALALPVLLIEGAASPPVVAEIGAALAGRIAGCRRQIIPGAGHMLAISHAGAVAGIIRDWAAS